MGMSANFTEPSAVAPDAALNLWMMRYFPLPRDLHDQVEDKYFERVAPTWIWPGYWELFQRIETRIPLRAGSVEVNPLFAW